ncbi:hypothetical protein MRB53_040321 [Persea americana]|nr:hypothetical protein MRB53_040321 [Persea americana]
MCVGCLYRVKPAIEIRLLSLIQIKNGIDKYWRKHASNAIPTDERDKIRSRVLQNNVEEHEHQLVNLRTIVVSKIARSDWPASCCPANDQGAFYAHHAAGAFRHVLLSGPLFTTIRDIYLALVDEWHKVLAIDEDPNVHESLELTLLSLKILRRIMTACFEFPHKENAHRDQKTLMGKHLIQLGKMHSYMARDHAVSFALLPGVVQLVHNYWNVAKALRDEQFQRPDMPEDDSTTFDIINLKALQMIRACVALLCKHTTSIKYRGASVKDDPPLAKELLSNGLLTPSFVHMLAVDIMTKFFV